MEMQKMKLVVVGNIDASAQSRGPGASAGMRPVRVGNHSIPAELKPRSKVL